MRTLVALIAGLLGTYALGVRAADAPAGTLVTNTANVQYTQGASILSQSAAANFIVDQLVDVTVTWQNTGPVGVTDGATQQALSFLVTNTGNGTDTFKLADSLVTPSGASFNPAGCLVYFDTANSGVYNSSDVLYTLGSNDPTLAQDASVKMLIVCNVPNNAADLSQGQMQLGVTSKTVSGAHNVNTGGGVGGVDAVAGLTGGAGNSTGTYQVHEVALAYAKSAAVSAPGGGNQPVSGATITYTLTVTPSGSAAAGNVVVTDPVPADTTFVPGSLTLNGAAVSAGTGDYNVTTLGAVTVKLGNVAGSATAQIVKFQVTIN